MEINDEQCRTRFATLKLKYKKKKAKMEKSGMMGGMGGYYGKWSFNKMDMLLLPKRQHNGLWCGVDSGKYVFMNTSVYLNQSNALDEMGDSPRESEVDEDEEEDEQEEDEDEDEEVDEEGFKLLEVFVMQQKELTQLRCEARLKCSPIQNDNLRHMENLEGDVVSLYDELLRLKASLDVLFVPCYAAAEMSHQGGHVASIWTKGKLKQPGEGEAVPSTAICSSRYCCLLFQEGLHVRFVKEAADSVMILKQQLLQSTTTTERVRDSSTAHYAQSTARCESTAVMIEGTASFIREGKIIMARIWRFIEEVIMKKIEYCLFDVVVEFHRGRKIYDLQFIIMVGMFQGGDLKSRGKLCFYRKIVLDIKIGEDCWEF
ncbi:hypothetical protein Tco_1154083 [Tanacetum coccineum]